jgi:hypothetical protein
MHGVVDYKKCTYGFYILSANWPLEGVSPLFQTMVVALLGVTLLVYINWYISNPNETLFLNTYSDI